MSSKRPLAAASALAKPLPAGRSVNVSTFALLFSELVAYYRGRSAAISDLEAKCVGQRTPKRPSPVCSHHVALQFVRFAPPLRRLEQAGYGVGLRCLELVAVKERPAKRETSVVGMLQFVSSALWQALFGKTADALEKSTDTANAYMIRDDEPLTNYFISVPRDLGRFNPAAYMAGILRGVLDAGGFPCSVQAVTVPNDAGPRDKTVFLIKFERDT
jgi:hypothetical protein